MTKILFGKRPKAIFKWFLVFSFLGCNRYNVLPIEIENKPLIIATVDLSSSEAEVLLSETTTSDGNFTINLVDKETATVFISFSSGSSPIDLKRVEGTPYYIKQWENRDIINMDTNIHLDVIFPTGLEVNAITSSSVKDPKFESIKVNGLDSESFQQNAGEDFEIEIKYDPRNGSQILMETIYIITSDSDTIIFDRHLPAELTSFTNSTPVIYTQAFEYADIENPNLENRYYYQYRLLSLNEDLTNYYNSVSIAYEIVDRTRQNPINYFRGVQPAFTNLGTNAVGIFGAYKETEVWIPERLDITE
jgi:hypothetical protein